MLSLPQRLRYDNYKNNGMLKQPKIIINNKGCQVIF